MSNSKTPHTKTPAIKANRATPDLPPLTQQKSTDNQNPPPFSASHQNPRHQGRVIVRGPPMPTGLETAAHYIDEQLQRWHNAHRDKYSPTTLKKLEELDDQVQDIRQDRLCGVIRPGDGTKILCILAQLNAMSDYMDQVDDLEKGWVWLEKSDADGLPLGTANDQPLEDTAKGKGQPLVDTDTDGEYEVVDKKNVQEDVNGGKNIGEQGVLATLQKYIKALKLH
ncbi:hypothetical protein QBC32DRAFT_225292 [Pseudoneurospora amorphoporcata]|uniref:Uncharacterized protein n=1 Tax=Pseudoneurospora amorphoporcata TaxID=241081 RepID=A0AAN6NJE5_9PEZI|nr:hypothetical protein QBC32DRAFT_225292 [Pseudoneurospora amorphoporcata]